MNDAERLAVLETVVDDMHEDLDSIKDDVMKIRESLAQLEIAVSNYKGFFGGVVFTVGAIAGVVGAVVASIWHRLSN